MTSADLNLRLIALVKKHPILYDSKHEKSKDKKAVAGTWSIISKEVGISGKNSKSSFMLDINLKWDFLENFLKPELKVYYNFSKLLLFDIIFV